MRLLVAILITFALAPAPSMAQIVLSRGNNAAAGTPTSCASDPSAATDGCSGANFSSNFFRPNFLTYAAMSGQTLAFYPCRAGQPACWYLAGAYDTANGQGGYPVGYYTSKSSLLDPTNQSNLPTGCTYYATGHAWYNGIGPMVDCAATASPTISGFDFGVTSGHGCVQLTFEANVTGTATVTNSNFEGDSVCAGAGTTLPAGIFFVGLIYFASGFTANATMTFDNFNGHWLDACCNAIYNSIVSQGKGLVPFFYQGNGGTIGLATMDYCAMFGFNGAGPSIENANAAAAAGGFIMKHTYQEGVQARAPYGHIDMTYFSGAGAAFPTTHYEGYYNTVIEPGTASATGTSWWFHSTNANAITTNVVIDHNTLAVGNLITGASTYNITAGGTIDNGSGSAGNIFTITSGGPLFVGASPSAGTFALADQINSTQWHIDCTINNTAPCNGTNKGQFAPTVSILNTVASAPFYAHWSNYPAIGHTHGTITNLTITNNYIDSFIDLAGGSSPFNIASPCTNPATVTGNVDMRNGNNLPLAGGGAGC